jgi:hypothetical protein
MVGCARSVNWLLLCFIQQLVTGQRVAGQGAATAALAAAFQVNTAQPSSLGTILPLVIQVLALAGKSPAYLSWPWIPGLESSVAVLGIHIFP